jgi:hypothetical protein
MRVIAIVVALCVAGCGLTMTKGPDPRQPIDQRPVCTETYAAPKKDGVVAVVGLVAIVFGAVAISAADNTTVGAPLLIGGGALMIGSYISGYVGYSRVKKCLRAVDAYEQRAGIPPR